MSERTYRLREDYRVYARATVLGKVHRSRTHTSWWEAFTADGDRIRSERPDGLFTYANDAAKNVAFRAGVFENEMAGVPSTLVPVATFRKGARVRVSGLGRTGAWNKTMAGTITRLLRKNSVEVVWDGTTFGDEMNRAELLLI